MSTRNAILPMLILALSGCGSSNPGNPGAGPDVSRNAASPKAADTTTPAPWFVRSDDDRGIVFMHDSGHDIRYFMPESVCAGAALFDMDNDGDLDAYLIQAGSLIADPQQHEPNRLFRNEGDGTFTDVTEGSGTDNREFGMGVVCGDYDQDGDVDLYLTNLGPNALLRNDGNGTFTDVTDTAGVGSEGWNASGAFFDYDKDGDLDLYVCSYMFWSVENEIDCYNTMGGLDFCSPRNYDSPASDVLYRNNSDGTFSDVTVVAGINQSFGHGLGVVAGDYNLDGWLDLFIANDGMKDQLWINQQNGTFINDALLAGCAVDQDGAEKAGMGVTTADLDDDGDLDLLVCNLFNESDSMYRNEGGMFTDVTSMAGLGSVSRSFTRFGMAWHDFNNDALTDLYQASGRIARSAQTYTDNPYAEPNLLFRGVGPLKFTEQLPRGGTAEPLYAISRAAAFGDVDNDGDIDILVANIDDRAHLLINEAPDQGHWVMFKVLNAHGSDAVNSTVSISLGDRRMSRDVRVAYSYLASNDHRVHFGLGDVSRIKTVTVSWLDGTTESFGDYDADQIVTLRKGEGVIEPE